MATINSKNIFLIEDHHEALKIWRKLGVKNLSLVHIDGHIDFGYPQAMPIQKVFEEAGSLKELKNCLEKTLAYLRYENDFDKQTNIGNYIYPAMSEGIVKNFYWIVPGGEREFRKSAKTLKQILKVLLFKRRHKIEYKKEKGIIRTELLGRKIIITTLKKLPIVKENILLDIDTDFLVIDSILNAESTKNIGKRKPWILPYDLVTELKNKIRQPEIITISYSVNGGYTPIRYKHLADEIAYYFLPAKFKRRFKKSSKAAQYFNLFLATGKKGYYQKAVRFNPLYRVIDNNYGPLYLGLGKFSRAKDQFLKIHKVDPKNPACLLGLGNIALASKNFKKAKDYFSSVLNLTNHRLFRDVKNRSLIGLGRAELGLKNFKQAKKLLIRYKNIKPLEPHSYYSLGVIREKERDFSRSATAYQDSLRLGIGSIEPISRLIKISSHLPQKDDIIRNVIVQFKLFKKGFLKAKKLSSKTGKNIRGAQKTEKKIALLEKKIALVYHKQKIMKLK